MSQPQPRGFGVVRRHAQVALDQRIQLVEQVRIHADAGRDGEEPGAAIAFKVGIFHPAQGNAPGLRGQKRAGRPSRGERQLQIVGQRVGRAQRNDAQGRRGFPPCPAGRHARCRRRRRRRWCRNPRRWHGAPARPRLPVRAWVRRWPRFRPGAARPAPL